MTNRDIVVIGGSSGATTPLRTILSALPQDLSAAVFIVLHIPARSLGILKTVAAAAGSMPVHAAADGMEIRPGNIYIAVPNYRLLLRGGVIQLGRGPRENMARPAIDPLFRSAAMAYGSRVIGVILSGLLNDGAAGLEAVKRCGGYTIVQDPADAVANEMPLSALAAVTADLTVPSIRIGDVLSELVCEEAGPTVPTPLEIQMEVDIAAGERVDTDVVSRFADPSPLTCPSCGGVLSTLKNTKPLRFRCQVGHSFTADVLAKEKESAVDEALRVALRIIEERAELVQRMADDGHKQGRPAIAEMYEERADEYRRYADTVRRAVLRSLTPPDLEGGENEPGGGDTSS